MFNIEKFYSEVRLFSNSLVVKINDIGSVMEEAYVPLITLKDRDRTKFRYYRHLKGEYYTSPEEYGYNPPFEDPKVMIKVVETEEVKILTKELLEQYPVTKEELLKQGDYYLDLINNNPRMITFIHGCLFPNNYTIEELIKIPDGAIIGYNSKMLEEQEYGLIKELEEFIMGFISRWHVDSYMVCDNLYLHSMLGVLYSHIPNKIVNIRIKNIRTHQVHSFFLESYFRSKFNLWDSIKILKKETIIWLYLNLDYLIKHLGRNETFQTLLTEVFAKNNVGIGGYMLQQEDVKLIEEDLYNVKRPPFSKTKGTVEKVKLNDKYIYNANDNISIEETLDREFRLTNKYNTDKENYLKNLYIKNIDNSIRDINKTKILEISTLKTFNGYNVDHYQVLLDYWGYFLSTNQYGSFTDDTVSSAKVEFVDPNTSYHYNLNSRSGYYVLLYVMLHALNGLDLLLDEVSVSTVLDKNVDLDKVLKESLFPDGYTGYFFDYIKNNYPKPNKSFTSYLDTKVFLDKVIEFYKEMWIHSSNSENIIVNANFKEFLFMTACQKKVKIHGETKPVDIKYLLRKEGCNFSIPEYGEYNHLLTIKELFKSCLGVTIDNLNELQDMLNKYKDIINKLTSYTLQVFGDIETENEHYMFYNTNNLFLSQKGLIELNKDVLEAKPLNTDFFKVRYLAERPRKEIIVWFYNTSLNSKLLDNYPSIGVVTGVKSDSIVSTCFRNATVDITKYRNNIPPRLFPNQEQQLLYLKEVNKIPDDEKHATDFNKHYKVDSSVNIKNSNYSKFSDGRLKGSARVMFNDDPTPRDTSDIDK